MTTTVIFPSGITPQELENITNNRLKVIANQDGTLTAIRVNSVLEYVPEPLAYHAARRFNVKLC
jgi:hypothetical protein